MHRQVAGSRRLSFDENTEDSTELLSLATTNDLFATKVAVKCDEVLQSYFANEILKYAESFQLSPHTFVFIENSINAEVLKKLKKHAEKIEQYKLLQKKEVFNIFQLSDALGLRDKKTLWVQFSKAIDAGKSGEEIAGTLFWQLKTMALLAKGESKSLNPYVASKAKQFLKNYQEEEIEKMSYDLILRYHEAHRGRYDLETALERFVLAI